MGQRVRHSKDNVGLIKGRGTLTDSGGGWLVDDSEDSETGDRSSVLGGSSLSVVEVWLVSSGSAIAD